MFGVNLKYILNILCQFKIHLNVLCQLKIYFLNFKLIFRISINYYKQKKIIITKKVEKIRRCFVVVLVEIVVTHFYVW